jgi:hypothetical protein
MSFWLHHLSSNKAAPAAFAMAAASAILYHSDQEQNEYTQIIHRQKSNLGVLLRSLLESNASTRALRCLCEAPPLTTIHHHDATILSRFSTKQYTRESRYKIDRVIGEGTFGSVYLARDRTNGDTVAIKQIPKHMTDQEAFVQEIQAMLHVQKNGGHPHICALRESFDEGDHYVLVLDYVSGGELFDHLVNSGPVRFFFVFAWHAV